MTSEAGRCDKCNRPIDEHHLDKDGRIIRCPPQGGSLWRT